MLKITQPYIRELPVTVDGQHLCLKIEPPGYTVGIRKRGGRTTYHVDMLDIWQLAVTNPETRQKGTVPKHIKTPKKLMDPETAIINVLEKDGQQNIARVLQQLNGMGLNLDRPKASSILELLKDMGRVKQTGFSYELVKGK